MQRLHNELPELYSRRPDPAELAASLAEPARDGGPVEVSDPAALAARLPDIPEDFNAEWWGASPSMLPPSSCSDAWSAWPITGPCGATG